MVSGFLSVLLGQNLLSCKIEWYASIIFTWVVIHFKRYLLRSTIIARKKERKYRQYTMPGKDRQHRGTMPVV